MVRATTKLLSASDGSSSAPTVNAHFKLSNIQYAVLLGSDVSCSFVCFITLIARAIDYS